MTPLLLLFLKGTFTKPKKKKKKKKKGKRKEKKMMSSFQPHHLGFALSTVGLLGVISRRASQGSKNGRWKSTLKAPVAKQNGKFVLIGAVEGENRGDNPMSPPKAIYDPYFWLRDDDRKNPDVISYLKEENAYCEEKMAPLQPLAKEMYKDFLSHIKETDESVPYPYGPFVYYSRTVEGSSYPIYCRKLKGTDQEQVLLDMNELAKGKKHCHLGGLQPSPDHSVLAYSIDETGYETYKAHFKCLETGKAILGEDIPDMTGSLVWGKDNKSIFYATHDDAHRPYKLWRHEMSSPGKKDQLMFHEPDEEFWLGMYKTRSGRYLVCSVATSLNSEVSILDLEQPAGTEMICVHPREPKLRYSIDHWGEWFYIVTNADGAKNQKLMKTPVSEPSKANWRQIQPYDAETTFEDLSCFQSKIVVEGRQGGFSCMWLLDPADDKLTKLEGFPEPVSTVGMSVNKEFDSSVVRIVYDSLVTPPTTLDVSFDTLEKKHIHQKTIPNYDPSHYCSKRLFAEGHDGTMIPMSMVYKRGSVFDTDGDSAKQPGPIFLDGYGSYGICNEPEFSSFYINFLDRGIAVVHAHIRGGGELGLTWHEDGGKFLTKKNTFKDFVSCAQHLIDNKMTDSNQLAIHGRSAGGLLMGSVLNMAPQLFKCAIMGVPFVDVVNTISDATIPLTVVEWDEWGNVNHEKYFDYMLSYSPYDNISAQNYPNIYITAGLFDPRVAYWEPAKYCAKLRSLNTGDNLILLKTDLDSGHFSASDRYSYYEKKAQEYAFVCHMLSAEHKL